MGEAGVRALTKIIYDDRRNRRVNPEGRFDAAGRWYPSTREDADGDGSKTRSPSRSWPSSYMLRCRTKQHCRALAERALAGLDVPKDVRQHLQKTPLLIVVEDTFAETTAPE